MSLTAGAKAVVSRVGALVAASIRKWADDRAPSMGAALAYYTAFSIAPLLVIVIAAAGLAVGHDAAQTAIVAQMRDLLGDSGGDAVEGMLRATADLGSGAIALSIGIGALLLGATTAFAELQDDLDRIWNAQPRSANGIVNIVRARLLSFGMVLCVAFLLTVSLVLNAAIAAAGQHMFGGTKVFLQALNFIVSVAVTTLLFAAIYKILPNTPIAWSDVWIGALITSLLFALGKLLIGLYIGKSSVASAFGSAGPFVALMVWIYYSTQVFLLGAEFTCVVARGHARAPSRLPGSDANRQRHSSLPLGGPAPVARSAQNMEANAAARFVGASAAGVLAGWVLTRIARSRLRSTN